MILTFTLVAEALMTASLVPSGENRTRPGGVDCESSSCVAALPGFWIQITSAPVRLDMKASVPSGAKLGDQVRPLAASTTSGSAVGVGARRARLTRLMSVTIARALPPTATLPVGVAVA